MRVFASYRRADSPHPVGPMPFRRYDQANAWLRAALADVPTAELGCILEEGNILQMTILAREDVLEEKS